MENGDIGLLRYCFSAAGQKNQKETADWLQKVSDCLQNAGAGKQLAPEHRLAKALGHARPDDRRALGDAQGDRRPVALQARGRRRAGARRQ